MIPESKVNPTHSFNVEDAIRLGSVEKAILLKEIGRFTVYKVRNGQDPWVYYSSTALDEKYPYMSRKSIQRWLLELEESGELVSMVKNDHKYDRTKSYTMPQFRDMVAQNDTTLPQNDTTIPPLSSPHIITEPFGENRTPHVSSLKRTEAPKRKFRAYDETQSYDDLPSVDAESGELADKTAKTRREPKNSLAMEACKYFQRACERATGTKPSLVDKGYYLVLRAISNGLIDAKTLRKRIDDWFASGQPQEKLVHITHAFSDYAIDEWKVTNGL